VTKSLPFWVRNDWVADDPMVKNWLKIAGVKTIIGIDIQSEKLKQALDLGVTDTIDPSVQDLEKRFLG